MTDENKNECSICSLIESYNNYNDIPNSGGSCAVCESEKAIQEQDLLNILKKIKGLDVKDAAVIAHLPDKKLREDLVNMILLVDHETNQMTKKGQRLEWTFMNNQYGHYFDPNIKDCGEQTMVATTALQNKLQLNYLWEFRESLSLGHVWGLAKATNLPNGYTLYLSYDPRARSFGLNRQCKSCKGWTGKTLGRLFGTDKIDGGEDGYSYIPLDDYIK